MKTSSLILALTCVALSSPAQAGVVLQVDLSNLNAVTFSSVNQNAQNSTSVDALYGISLMDFFTSATFAPQTPSGINTVSVGLSPTGSGQDIDTYYSVGSNGSYTGLTLNLTGGSSLGTTWSFNSSSRAFSGSATADFHLIPSGGLPLVGATGDIKIGAYGSVVEPGTIIGQWEVVNLAAVPEPASVGVVAGLVLGGFAFARRRMRTA